MMNNDQLDCTTSPVLSSLEAPRKVLACAVSKRFPAQRRGPKKIWMGESHMGPATRSDDHHHGESETGIYVLSGNPVFVFLHGNEETRIEAKPGDYVCVPPKVAHREENPSDEEAVVIMARTTQEAIVVNLTSLK